MATKRILDGSEDLIGYDETLGSRVFHARKLRGLTQPVVANRSGISKGAISQIENDQIKTIKSEIVFPLADCLGVSARWLATGEGDLGTGNDVPRMQSDPLREEVLRKIDGFSAERGIYAMQATMIIPANRSRQFH